MLRFSLRTKFLLSLALISALLTWGTLLLVRERVQVRVRAEIVEALHNSVFTFQTLQQQREVTLQRSAALLAALPPLKAVMTSRDMATIQDASMTFWSLAGSQLFVLGDGSGALMALHTSQPGFTRQNAQDAMLRSLGGKSSRDWWFGGGRLFEVFLQPIYFGAPGDNTPMGILAMGYEVDDALAADIGRVASSRVAFQYDETLVVNTLPDAQRPEFSRQREKFAPANGQPQQIQLGSERFLASSVALSKEPHAVVLTVLKSYDEATAFLRSLNNWIVIVGFASVLAGSLLVFLVSTTFTRPLADLVAGVRALEKGDYSYPLQVRGHDEVSVLTTAFHRMRIRLKETQEQLLDAERLATIGRMASMISHDLRHPLTAILAYAEFLSERNLSEAQRKDCHEEIRIAVNRMTDEINSLLGFSKQREPIRPAHARADEIIERAMQAVKILPEHEKIEILLVHDPDCSGWFDPAKLERVVLNLLFNACEAVSPESGRIELTCRRSESGLEVTVADNGPGIAEAVRKDLFQPFVSFGKEKGTGLGLTVVHKIMQDHGGEVVVERSGPEGTVFKLTLPSRVPEISAVLSPG